MNPEIENLINKLEIEEFGKEQLKISWLHQLERCTKSKKYHSIRYYIYQMLILISATLIPVVNNLETSLFDTKLTVTILGIVVALSAGLNQIFQHGEKWSFYGRNMESLKSEGMQFLGLSGNYNKFKNHVEALPLFIEFLENKRKAKIENYFNFVNTAGEK